MVCPHFVQADRAFIRLGQNSISGVHPNVPRRNTRNRDVAHTGFRTRFKKKTESRGGK